MQRQEKIRPPGQKTPAGGGFAHFSRKKQKSHARGVVTVAISALADDLLGAAEDHVVDILLDEVLKHIGSHAPFLHLLQFVL